jgi:hypothetical protein
MEEKQPQDFDARLNALEKNLGANTALTAKLSADMETFLTIFGTLEAGFKVLGAIGRLAKWFAPIITIAAAVWAIMHGKWPPLE